MNARPHAQLGVIAVIAVLVPHLILAAPAQPPSPDARNATDARALSNFTQHVDVRPVLGHEDRLGIDFDLRYEKQRSEANFRNTYSLVLAAKGFETFDRDIPDANSMTAEASVQGAHFSTPHQFQRTPAEQARWDTLANYAPENNPPRSMTPEEAAEYAGLNRTIFERSSLFTYDLHYRLEANHDFSHTQNVGGIGSAFEVPLLDRLLDFVPSIVRSPEQWRPQPVCAYAAVEYVDPNQDSLLVFARDKVDRLWRVRLESAWRTRIAQGVDLRAEARADWLPDAPDFVHDAGRELNGFVQIWLLYPLGQSTHTAAMIKYFDGRLAPEYKSVSGGKVGLTFSFQPI